MCKDAAIVAKISPHYAKIDFPLIIVNWHVL